MPVRLYIEPATLAEPWAAGALSPAAEWPLPPAAARHAQVRRVQPGDALVLFDGRGGEWAAQVLRMGRSEVRVRIGAHAPVERELRRPLRLAVGMPANERMDWLVEKATELGAAVIQPLMCERSVLRLDGERALRKVAHWQAVAVAAAEQSGRTRLPVVLPVRALAGWLMDGLKDGLSIGHARGPADDAPQAAPPRRLLLSLRADARPLQQAAAGDAPLWLLSGPEGGLSPDEEASARAAGFAAAGLGPRVLRAETAPLAALAVLAALDGLAARG